jgi:hypothetical protein
MLILIHFWKCRFDNSGDLFKEVKRRGTNSMESIENIYTATEIALTKFLN